MFLQYVAEEKIKDLSIKKIKENKIKLICKGQTRSIWLPIKSNET